MLTVTPVAPAAIASSTLLNTRVAVSVMNGLGVSILSTPKGVMSDTAARVESTDFAFFVTAVMINRQTGGELSEVLKNISHTIHVGYQYSKDEEDLIRSSNGWGAVRIVNETCPANAGP